MKAMLPPARLREIFETCKTLRIGVLGDYVLDAYFTVDMPRAQLSRETPLYNRPVIKEKYSPGAAANVVWNLTALGVGKIHALTVLGRDWRGILLQNLLSDMCVGLDTILTQADWLTPLYGKILLSAHDNKQEDSRLDFVNIAPISNDTEEVLIQEIAGLLPKLDALVIVDYLSPGVVTPRIRECLSQFAEDSPRVIFLADSRDHISQFSNIVIKPNEVEAIMAVAPGRIAEEMSYCELRAVGRHLLKKANRPVFLTMGAKGCMLIEGSSEQKIDPVKQPFPIDPVGAGDTFLVGVAVGLAAGASPFEAGMLATLASAVTLRKLHVTGTATPEEILTLYEGLSKPT